MDARLSALPAPKHLHVWRICQWCKGPFQVLARQARRKNRAKFCGRSCQSRFIGRLQEPRCGAANPAWRGGVSRFPYRYTKRFVAKFPHKRRVQVIVHAAIKAGKLVRPPACPVCFVVRKVHAHHEDYSKPLAVTWLCQSCHNALHSERARRTRAALRKVG